MLPKAPQAVINLSLITLPGYHNYLNFDPDNYNPTLTNIRGVGIFVHHKLQASQIYFNTPHFEDHVWANVKLQGSDSLLVGCIYRSPSSNIDTSTASLCSLFADITYYSHLLICGDFNYTRRSLGLIFLVLLITATLNHSWMQWMTCFYFNMLQSLQGLDKGKLPACWT